MEIAAIWQTVLIRALPQSATGVTLPNTWEQCVNWVSSSVEEAESALRRADSYYAKDGKRFLLVFDALDRLGADWPSIRELSKGILRLALELRGYRALRAKVFMRFDQASDDTLFHFPDASKLRAEKVDLVWRRRDLYGLLYSRLWADGSSKSWVRALMPATVLNSEAMLVPKHLIEDEELQTELFFKIAGEFMGSDRRRGRTYSWFYDHLADAFGETSPRSFLIALQRAAQHEPPPRDSAIDHNGLRFGVQEASSIRLEELREDYGWIRVALESLEGLEVPCTPSNFVARWVERGTAEKISSTTSADRLGPVEFEETGGNRAQKLLSALEHIGVVERRSEFRINMPDIFRVAARIKRRGGVRPPMAGGRR